MGCLGPNKQGLRGAPLYWSWDRALSDRKSYLAQAAQALEDFKAKQDKLKELGSTAGPRAKQALGDAGNRTASLRPGARSERWSGALRRSVSASPRRRPPLSLGRPRAGHASPSVAHLETHMKRLLFDIRTWGEYPHRD